MAGFLIALLSGALMSVQGVFNAQVTKTTGIWVSNGPKKTIISWYHFSSRSYQNHPASFAGTAAPLSAITGGSCQYLANGSILLLQSHVPPTLGHPLSACVGFLCKSAIKVLSFSSLLSHTFLE